jgi:methyl-accepting chemotaxis protein
VVEKWSTTKSLILRSSSNVKPESINSAYDDIVGNLSVSANIDRQDEIGQLAGAINPLQKTLRGGNKMKAA